MGECYSLFAKVFLGSFLGSAALVIGIVLTAYCSCKYCRANNKCCWKVNPIHEVNPMREVNQVQEVNSMHEVNENHITTRHQVLKGT